MADNVTPIRPGPIGSGIHLEPDQVLEAWKGKLKEVVVIGNMDGSPFMASSEGVERTLWLIEKAKIDVLL
jgi:hypothetical protein